METVIEKAKEILMHILAEGKEECAELKADIEKFLHRHDAPAETPPADAPVPPTNEAAGA